MADKADRGDFYLFATFFIVALMSFGFGFSIKSKMVKVETRALVLLRGNNLTSAHLQEAVDVCAEQNFQCTVSLPYGEIKIEETINIPNDNDGVVLDGHSHLLPPYWQPVPGFSWEEGFYWEDDGHPY